MYLSASAIADLFIADDTRTPLPVKTPLIGAERCSELATVGAKAKLHQAEISIRQEQDLVTVYVSL